LANEVLLGFEFIDTSFIRYSLLARGGAIAGVHDEEAYIRLVDDI
jgi:hypothetical protein